MWQNRRIFCLDFVFEPCFSNSNEVERNDKILQQGCKTLEMQAERSYVEVKSWNTWIVFIVLAVDFAKSEVRAINVVGIILIKGFLYISVEFNIDVIIRI